VAGIKK
jgi:hypothetical protein